MGHPRADRSPRRVPGCRRPGRGGRQSMRRTGNDNAAVRPPYPQVSVAEAWPTAAARRSCAVASTGSRTVAPIWAATEQARTPGTQEAASGSQSGRSPLSPCLCFTCSLTDPSAQIGLRWWHPDAGLNLDLGQADDRCRLCRCGFDRGPGRSVPRERWVLAGGTRPGPAAPSVMGPEVRGSSARRLATAATALAATTAMASPTAASTKASSTMAGPTTASIQAVEPSE